MSVAREDVSQAGRALANDELEPIHRMTRNQLTIIRARTQLIRRRLKNGSLDPTHLDSSLEQVDLAVTRIDALLNRIEAQSTSESGVPAKQE